MKKTQLIEIRRSIQKTIVTFLAIAVIVVLGVAVYLGIHFAAQGLENTNTIQYHKEQFQDFEMVSVFGYTKEDVEAVNKLSHIETASGRYSLNVEIRLGERKETGKVISYSPNISHGELREGIMPKQAGECAVEERFAEQNQIQVGDSISVAAQKDAEQEYLFMDKLKVTGIIAYIGSNKKTGTILASEKLFSEQAFSGVYTSIVLRLKASSNLPIYSDAYQKAVKESREMLQLFADERTRLRYEEIRSNAEENLIRKKEMLASAQVKLDDGFRQIEENKKKLSDGEREYEEGRKKLEKGERELAVGEKELQEGGAELESGRQELEKGYNELERGRQELEVGRRKLDEGYTQFMQLEQTYTEGKKQTQDTVVRELVLYMGISQEQAEAVASEDMIFIETYITDKEIVLEFELVEALLDRHSVTDPVERTLVHTYAAGLNMEESIQHMQSLQKKIKQYKEELNQGDHLYANKLQEYNEGLAKYEAGLNLYNKGLQQYEAGKKKLEDARKEYAEGKQKLLDSEQKLKEGRERLEKAQISYDKQTEAYKKNETKFTKAEKRVEQITPVWSILLGRNEQPSYVNIGINAQNLKKLGISFAVSFMLVAVMACYSAISRMVEEQRKLGGRKFFCV